MAANNIVTLDEVKTGLGIADSETSKDKLITLFIPIVQDAIIKSTKNDFEDDDGNQAFPKSLKAVAIGMIGYHLGAVDGAGKQSETIGKWSTTYNQEYPAWVKDALKPHNKVTFK